MIKMFTLFLFIFNKNIFSQSLNLHCLTNDKNTQITIEQKSNKVLFTYLNLGSRDEIPLFSGIVTRKNKSLINLAERDLRQLYPKMTVEWSLDDCQVVDQVPVANGLPLIDCVKPGVIIEPTNLKLQVNSVTTSQIKEENIRFIYEKYQIYLNIKGTNGIHSSVFAFQPDACTNEINKSNLNHF